MSIEEERGPLYYAISLQSQALTLFHMIELLDTQGAYTLRCFMQRIEENGEGKKGHSVIIGEEPYAESQDSSGRKAGSVLRRAPKARRAQENSFDANQLKPKVQVARVRPVQGHDYSPC